MKEMETKIEKGKQHKLTTNSTELNNKYLSIYIYYTPTVAEFHDKQTVIMFNARLGGRLSPY